MDSNGSGDFDHNLNQTYTMDSDVEDPFDNNVDSNDEMTDYDDENSDTDSDDEDAGITPAMLLRELDIDPGEAGEGKILHRGKNYQIITGYRKGYRLYTLDNFMYKKVHARPNKINFICQQSKCKIQKCPASAVLNIETDIMKMGTTEHNHPNHKDKIGINRLRHELLDAAGNLTGRTLHQLFTDITNADDKYGDDISYIDIESGMRKRRNQVYPRNPKSLEEIDILMKDAPLGLSSSYQGIVELPNGEATAIVLGHQKLMELMVEIKTLGYDGTFYVVPKPFYQLWTIHMIVEGHCFPGLSFLFMGKDTEQYKAAWRFAQDILGEDFRPEHCTNDFEGAAIEAAKCEQPQMQCNGCLFHSCNCKFKNMRRFGLYNAWKEQDEFRIWLKRCMAVPMLPPKYIKKAYMYLLRKNIFFPRLADIENFKRFKRYVQKQWVDNKKIPPELLSVYACETTTTGTLENFHGRIRCDITIHRPNFWHFVFQYNRILKYFWKQYCRLRKGKRIGRGQRKKIRDNITARNNAGIQLEIDEDWKKFLYKVSHTQDSLIRRLGQQTLDEQEIAEQEIRDLALECCFVCGLIINQRLLILDCNHANICGGCLIDLKENNEVCPNPNCGDVIVDFIPIRLV